MDPIDLMSRAAWLYHMEGMTQAQIADRLNVTRRRINEMLAAALREGLVVISFKGKLADCAALEMRLCQAFGLEDALVVPTPEDPAQMHPVMGRAVAAYLDRFIPAKTIGSLGVGWGSTLRETLHFMTPMSRPGMEVHSMMGGLTRGSEINTFEIVRGFANNFSAECRYFAAPIYADSPESRDAIISQGIFRRALERIRDVDLSYLSVGDVSNRSLQVRYGLPDGVIVEDLIAMGAVGDLASHFLDAQGQPIDHPLNRQLFAPDLQVLKEIRHRLIVAGGPHKIPIVRAVLAAGYATILAIDSDCAAALLEG